MSGISREVWLRWRPGCGIRPAGIRSTEKPPKGPQRQAEEKLKRLLHADLSGYEGVTCRIEPLFAERITRAGEKDKRRNRR